MTSLVNPYLVSVLVVFFCHRRQREAKHITRASFVEGGGRCSPESMQKSTHSQGMEERSPTSTLTAHSSLDGTCNPGNSSPPTAHSSHDDPCNPGNSSTPTAHSSLDGVCSGPGFFSSGTPFFRTRKSMAHRVGGEVLRLNPIRDATMGNNASLTPQGGETRRTFHTATVPGKASWAPLRFFFYIYFCSRGAGRESPPGSSMRGRFLVRGGWAFCTRGAATSWYGKASCSRCIRGDPAAPMWLCGKRQKKKETLSFFGGCCHLFRASGRELRTQVLRKTRRDSSQLLLFGGGGPRHVRSPPVLAASTAAWMRAPHATDSFAAPPGDRARAAPCPCRLRVASSTYPSTQSGRRRIMAQRPNATTRARVRGCVAKPCSPPEPRRCTRRRGPCPLLPSQRRTRVCFFSGDEESSRRT